MDWDYWATAQRLGDILLAYILALPIGWERERAAEGAGIRTFPLVSATSCCFILLVVEAQQASTVEVDRVIAGLITGIGFIGGGAIIKSQGEVHGTATAAAVWSVGAIGTAVGIGSRDIAVLLCLISIVTLVWLKRLKTHAKGEESIDAVLKAAAGQAKSAQDTVAGKNLAGKDQGGTRS
jgi:putative Mg2+ transporter-C (MgtC) family protein